MLPRGVTRYILLASFLAGCASNGTQVAPAARTIPERSILLRHQHHRILRGVRISSSGGDCLRIWDSSDVTVEASEIGPCGGNGVSIRGGNEIRIYDNYIHPETLSSGCCDRNDGVLVQHATGVTIRGNVIAYGESNVEALENATGLQIVGNFLLNPRGPFPRGQNVQIWGADNASVRDNYTLSSRNTKRFLYPDDQEDSINFGEGSRFVADGNYVTGGHSASGCGLLADDGANEVRMVANRVVDSGECGIGVASGAHQIVDRNRVINRNPVRGGGNTAVYVWNQYRRVPCGPVNVSNNVATEVRRDGAQSGFWNGGGCDPVVRRDNTWDEAARKVLTPVRENCRRP